MNGRLFLLRVKEVGSIPEDYRDFKSACGPLLPPVEVPPVIPPLPQALEPGGETTPGGFSDASKEIKNWSVC